jgi:hypothetical protein
MELKQKYTKGMNKIDEFDVLRSTIQIVSGCDIKNKSKKTDFVYARMVFYVLMRNQGCTFQSIGDYVGKDHATVLVGIRQFYNLITQDKYLKDVYFECSRSFKERVEPIRVIGKMPNNSYAEELQYRIDSLILENERLQKSKAMHNRFKEILKEMDVRTPLGMEDVLAERVTKMFNGDIFK